ncbi:hypothetical protein Pth03_82830 [Planotetraspora thailandica]|uniref:Peptide-methionine (S)-S-oxide reductase n=1 Tax=Planotetraspora thailandica TaxID=487172 RepID=A0A8J4DFG5_9ACTN|nr:hypothetical protein Pth03_82830 [Planotetraspora thailandica]
MTTCGVNYQPEPPVLAGGCFWGMQDLLRKKDAVCRLGWEVAPTGTFWEAEPEHQDY